MNRTKSNKLTASRSPFIYFFDLEKEMNMFSLSYKGIYFWQLIRFDLIKTITIRNQTVINQNRKTSRIKLLLYTAFNAAVQVNAYANLRHSDLVVLKPEGTYYKDKCVKEKEFDFFDIHEFKRTEFFLLGEYSSFNKYKVNDLSIPELEYMFWKLASRKMRSKYDDSNGIVKAFINRINSYYHIDLQYDDLLKRIDNECVRFEIFKKWYDKCFKRIRPKAIMLSTHYHKSVFPATCSAREMGIKTIEIQHGRINAHEAYYYSDLSNKGKILPDFLLTYGQWWNCEVQLPEMVNIIATGNPFLESMVRPTKSEDNEIVVSVFSGPQTGVILSKLIMQCDGFFARNGIKIMYKLHPSELLVWKREYPWLHGTNSIEIFDDIKTNVYDLLNKSDFCIAVNSTVLFEATVYPDLNILVYQKEDIDPMRPLIELGYALTFKDEEELEQLLLNNCNIRKSNSKNPFYLQNAAKNTRETIICILSNQERKNV